jgi:hypothetical protein
MSQVTLKSYCRNCGTPVTATEICCMGTVDTFVVSKPAISSSAKEARTNFGLASRILGRKVALLALSRMAKKLNFFAGEYTLAVYADLVSASMSVLGHATKWTTCPRKYKAHQRALHALRDCLNSPENWTVR